jgi:hypothetical protein
MGFLGFGKKDDFVDLSERFKKNQATANAIKEELKTEKSTSGVFPMFFGNANNSNSSNDYVNVDSGLSESGEEKRRKLAKRLVEMTKKLEDLDNKIYHLQQRIEVLERKNTSGVGF